MLKIRVVGFHGKPLTDNVWAEFDAKGGTIGRAPDNTLPLPDAERHVSRIHASVTCAAGEYAITDLGTVNPLRVNGQPLGQGNKAKLADGDELGIGDYLLAVDIEQPVAATQATQQRDVFAELVSSALSSGSVAAAPGAATTGGAARNGASIIPEDFDPFADRTPTAPTTPPIAEGVELGPTPGAVGPSIDELFNLSGASAEPFIPGGPLSEPIGESGAPPAGAKAGMAAQPDQIPEIHGSFQTPRAHLAEAPAPGPETDHAGEAFYVSWESPGATAASRSVVEVSPRAATDDQAPARTDRPRREAMPQQVSAEKVAGPTREELMQSFLDGLGLTGLSLPEGVTPTFMCDLGQLLREATQGTLDLLLARAMTKQEIRADVTLILGKENNPLKFSPTVEVALTHLLAPTAAGFMGPREAMKDAYADLRAHQFGFMAGMRAALAGVLARFDPTNLERRLTQKSMLGDILPMNRRARLWDLYTNLYGDISQEVEEDFHALFGKEFLRAYEAQVERLRNKPGA